jgi:signal transduction histidine kinase
MSTDVTIATAVPASLPAKYGRLWVRVPKELAYLFIAFPIAVVVFSVVIGLFSAGAGTIVTFFIGLVLIIVALYISRGSGTLDLALLRWVGVPPIAKPDWQDARARTGFFGWLRAVLGNGHYWLYLLYAGLVQFVVSTFTWSIMITWVATALGGLSYWFWSIFLPHPERNFYPVQWLLEQLGFPVSGADGRTLESITYFVLGVIFAFTLPFITRGLTSLHGLVARGMLSAFRSEALKREVATLSESRSAAVSAEGTALRRLERDIHDGPQQRLVRMQMDLAAADRQLAEDPDAARKLITEAQQQAKDALDELRALSRGFAPPILLDRGLVAALESLAVRSTVPARVTSTLPAGTDLPSELQRNAYFIAAEALTNASKHSGAQNVTIDVSLRRVPEPEETWLDLVVTDDGVGGAAVVAGHGLAGLQERSRGLGGIVELTSPAGGPTVVSVHLPVTYSTAG